MRDKESKREREKKMVSEMIALYCKKKHHTKITRKKDGSSSARNAWHCQSMRARAVINVRLWRPRPSARTARFTVINRKCGKRSVKSCALAGRGCFFIILL